MGNSCRILVVDDEPRGAELTKRALFSLGDVDVALTGEDGWEIARRGGIDLIISDQRMPGMSGVELLERVADRDEFTGRIMLTGYADIDAAVAAINGGRVHAYLTKPCPPEQLEVTARSVMERVRLARENERLVRDLSQMIRKLKKTLDSLAESQRRVVASEQLAAIGRMSAMIVHDMRGPLSVLRSSGAEVIREAQAASSSGLQELGVGIVEESDRLNRICSELLEVARVSEREIQPTEEDLDDVVRAALAQVAEEASLAGVRVELDLGCRTRVPIDEDYVRRALLNLTSNAIQAMPDGGVLRLVSRRDGEWAVVSVLDSGVGIPEEVRDDLFEAFVTVGKVGGTGLGLAVVKMVMDKHHGEVEVGKAEGGETAFHLRFPLHPRADE
jgi:signal transduction histidine kinase